MAKTRAIKLQGVEGRDAHDQIAFCTFHSVACNYAELYNI